VTAAHRRALGLWAVACAVRLWMASRWGVLADEAYYWAWSRELALGYFDHPPLLAWLLAPWPAHPAAVRLPGWALTTAGGAALVSGSRQPVALAAILSVLPPLWLFGTLATPDAPLLGLWMLALAAAQRGRLGLVGPLGALATLAKYPGIALAPLLWLARWRTATSSRAVAAGAVAGIALLVPHGWWSFHHGHPALLFQAAHGLAGDGLLWVGPLAMAAQQLALSGGLLGLAATGALWHGRYTPAWWASAPVLAVFALASLSAPSEANWPAPAWVGLAVLLAALPEGRWQRLMQSGVWLTGMLSVVALLHTAHPVGRWPGDPSLRLHTGRAFASTAAKFIEPVPGEAAIPVLTERYQEAAWLRWHRGLDAVVWRGCGRPNQFDDRPASARAWFVRPSTSGPPACVTKAWEVVDRRGFTEHDAYGRRLGRWDVFELRRR